MCKFKNKYNLFLLISSIICVLFTVINLNTKIFGEHIGGKISKKNTIPIAMALDDNYLYPTIVSITSMMENINSEKTQYEYYIMHPGEFSQDSQDKLKTLEKKYKNKNCKINFINMGELYKNAKSDKRITTPSYYRLSLSDLDILKNISKIIWLDGDTLVYKDLTDMYNLDMTDLCYRGFLDPNVHAVDKLIYPEKNDHVICAGVMLVNLDELRKNNMVKKFSDFIEKNNEKLAQHDQTTINSVAYQKIDIFPVKYGVFNGSNNYMSKLAKKYIYKNKYSKEELLEARKNPVVLHFTCGKPWKNKKVYGAKLWWDYAKKTDFYQNINTYYHNIKK